MTPTVPILLTLFRLLLIPVIVMVYYSSISNRYGWSALIFAVACFTDWLDGYLARSWGQTSKFGAFLDPVADKLIVAVALVLVLSDKNLPLLAIPVMIIICREITISALREWMSTQGRRTSMAVSLLGKIKTTLQMTSLIMLLMHQPGRADFYGVSGYILIWLAALLTLCTMMIYVKIAWKELRD